MNSRELDSLPKDGLSYVCFEPLIQAYKARVSEQSTGDGSTVKEQFYKELTNGQQALFSFHIYYNHASKSLTEFYWWNAYFMAQPTTWSAIKSGLNYFGGGTMLHILGDVEVTLKESNHPVSLDGFNVTREDMMRDQNLLDSIKLLHAAFVEASPATLQLINAGIHNNLNEFITIEV
jgi:hypothetical protein